MLWLAIALLSIAASLVVKYGVPPKEDIPDWDIFEE